MATTAGPQPPGGNVQTDADRLDILRLAYESGIRYVEAQEASLSSVRTNAAAVAALNGLVATLLGRNALEDRHAAFGFHWLSFSIPEWCAILTLLVSVVCLVQIFRPRHGWVFHFSPTSIVDQFAFGPRATTLPNTYKVMTRFLDENLAKNRKLLTKLYWWLGAAIVFLFLQTLCWLVATA